ncbi:hypothetical protein LguiB_027938 [Lonicera macranthoides]
MSFFVKKIVKYLNNYANKIKKQHSKDLFAAFWSVYTTHKDLKYFPDPEKFDPSRFEGKGPIPFTFVPLGGGPRMCPGNKFDRLEVLIFMHRLVTKFRWDKLILNEKIVYEPSPIPINGLLIRLFPHQN